MFLPSFSLKGKNNKRVVSKCMFYFFRPSFEVVKEEWILKKIKHLQRQNVSVFSCASPDANWRCQFDQDADRSVSIW